MFLAVMVTLLIWALVVWQISDRRAKRLQGMPGFPQAVKRWNHDELTGTIVFARRLSPRVVALDCLCSMGGDPGVPVHVRAVASSRLRRHQATSSVIAASITGVDIPMTVVPRSGGRSATLLFSVAGRPRSLTVRDHPDVDLIVGTHAITR